MGNTAHSHQWDGMTGRGFRLAHKLCKGMRPATPSRVDQLIQESERNIVVMTTGSDENPRPRERKMARGRRPIRDRVVRAILSTSGWFTADDVAEQHKLSRGTVGSTLTVMTGLKAVTRKSQERDGMRPILKHYVNSAWVQSHKDPVAVVEAEVEKQGFTKNPLEALVKLCNEHQELAQTHMGKALLMIHARVLKGVQPKTLVESFGISDQRAVTILDHLVTLQLAKRTPWGRYQRGFIIDLHRALTIVRENPIEPARPRSTRETPPAPVPTTPLAMDVAILEEENSMKAEVLRIETENALKERKRQAMLRSVELDRQLLELQKGR